MKVLIAPDKFKGTLSAQEAAEAIEEAVRRHDPSWSCLLRPLADGGEGTAALLTRACGGLMLPTTASDALFRGVRCEYGVSPDGKTAFIDASQASGLQRLSPNERTPLKTSSRGTGEMIAQALQRRVKRIVLGLGGTATLDAGIGMLHALGVVLQDEDRRPLLPTAANLGKVEYLNLSPFVLRDSKVELIFLADVAIPLIDEDPNGGVMRFARQKGLPDTDRIYLHAAFGKFRNLMDSKYKGQSKLPGMGSGGGIAFGLAAIYPSMMYSGAEWVMRELEIEAAIHAADLVITGEGQLDETTQDGKCISVLAGLCAKQQKNILAVVGRNKLQDEDSAALGLMAVEAIDPAGTTGEPDRASAFDALVQATLRALRRMAPALPQGQI